MWARSCFRGSRAKLKLFAERGDERSVKRLRARRSDDSRGNKLNFLNFDAKLDYYIFAARAQEEKQSRPHRESRLKRQRQSRGVLACSGEHAFVNVFVFPPPTFQLLNSSEVNAAASQHLLSSWNTAEKSNFQTSFAPGNRERRGLRKQRNAKANS